MLVSSPKSCYSEFFPFGWLCNILSAFPWPPASYHARPPAYFLAMGPSPLSPPGVPGSVEEAADPPPRWAQTQGRVVQQARDGQLHRSDTQLSRPAPLEHSDAVQSIYPKFKVFIIKFRKLTGPDL